MIMSNNKMHFYFIIGLILSGQWLLTTYINQHLALQIVYPLNKSSISKDVLSPNLQSFYPVWVGKPKVQGLNSNDGENIDELFNKVEIVKNSEAKQINFAELLKNAIVVQAIGASGAIINQRFYNIGDKLDFKIEGLQPVLMSVDGKTATIRLGNKSVLFNLES